MIDWIQLAWMMGTALNPTDPEIGEPGGTWQLGKTPVCFRVLTELSGSGFVRAWREINLSPAPDPANADS